MNLVYGTGNQAKLEHMREAMCDLNLTILGLKDIDAQVPEVEEAGHDPQENAILKATTYYQTLKRPVFSCDSGLFIEGLPDDQQPGVHIRRIAGKRLDDEEMITHYAAIARSLGGRCVAQYRNAICLVLSETQIITHMHEDIYSHKFLLVGVPHPRRHAGYPLDSLSVHIASGRYYYDSDERQLVTDNHAQGFQDFFKRVLKL